MRREDEIAMDQLDELEIQPSQSVKSHITLSLSIFQLVHTAEILLNTEMKRAEVQYSIFKIQSLLNYESSWARESRLEQLGKNDVTKLSASDRGWVRGESEPENGWGREGKAVANVNFLRTGSQSQFDETSSISHRHIEPETLCSFSAHSLHRVKYIADFEVLHPQTISDGNLGSIIHVLELILLNLIK